MKISEETRRKVDKVEPYVIWFCIVGFAAFAIITSTMIIREIAAGRYEPITTLFGILTILVTYMEIRYDFLDSWQTWKKEHEVNNE